MTIPADLPALDPPRRRRLRSQALDSAYQQLLRSNGSSSAAVQAVAAASQKVNAICPGAAA